MQQVVQVENYWTLRNDGWTQGEDLARPYEDAALVRVPFLLFHDYDDSGQVSIKPIDAVQVSEGYTLFEHAQWTRWFPDEAAAQAAALGEYLCNGCGSTTVHAERHYPGGDVNWFALRLMHDGECWRWQSHLEALRKRRAKEAAKQAPDTRDPLLRLADRLEAEIGEPSAAAPQPKRKRKRKGPPARKRQPVTGAKGG
jgi:hypothetical protein